MNTQTIDQHAHEDKLLPLFAQLAAAVMERGLDHARKDDPHAFATAQRWLLAHRGCFQLVVNCDPGARKLTTTGRVTDASGEPVVEVFTISGQWVDGKTH